MTDHDEELDDSLEIELRSPEMVGRRLIALASCIRRVFLEVPQSNDHEEDTEVDEPADLAFDLRTWLASEEVDGDLSSSERSFLDAPVGSIDGDRVEDVTWQIEALQALGWAVGLLDELPSIVDLADARVTLERIPQPMDETRSFLKSVATRAEIEIAEAREVAELWRWRALIELDRLSPNRNVRLETERLIRDVAHETRASGLIGVREDDLSIDGVAFGGLSPDDQLAVEIVATQRLQAFNWICGFGSNWHDVPLDV